MHRVVAVSSGSVDSHQKNGRCISLLSLSCLNCWDLLGYFMSATCSQDVRDARTASWYFMDFYGLHDTSTGFCTPANMLRFPFWQTISAYMFLRLLQALLAQSYKGLIEALHGRNLPGLDLSEIRSTRVHQHVLNSDAHWQRYAIDIHLEKQERSDLIDSNHLRLTIVSSCKSQARRAGPGFEVCSFDLLCIWSQCALNLGFHCLGGVSGRVCILGPGACCWWHQAVASWFSWCPQ